MVVVNLSQMMRAFGPDVLMDAGPAVPLVYPGPNFERAYRPALAFSEQRAIPSEAEKYAVRVAEQNTNPMRPSRASMAVSGQNATESEILMGELQRQKLPMDLDDYGQREVVLSGTYEAGDWSDRRLLDIDVPVANDIFAPIRPAAPVEVAAPVAQAAQRGGAKDPPRRRIPSRTNQPPAAGAPPAPADTPAENTPAAQVAEAAEKQKFDLVDAAWNRPDFGLIQDALVEHQGWTRDDAQIAARVAAGGLASVVGIPLLAAALNELNG